MNIMIVYNGEHMEGIYYQTLRQRDVCRAGDIGVLRFFSKDNTRGQKREEVDSTVAM